MKYDNWDEFMAAQRRSGLLQRMSEFVTHERNARLIDPTHDKDVYPASADVFRFTMTPLRSVKVVILGQDPYHGPGQADGLAFSVRQGVKVPPSLKNIIFELRQDIGNAAISMARRGQIIDDQHFVVENGDFTPWTRQGVLLLNTALTVRQDEPGSNLDVWQPFTDEVVRAVVDSADVAPHFILWGAKATTAARRALKANIVKTSDEGIAILRPPVFPMGYRQPFPTCTYSSHPSPLSADRGFFGSRPFSRANLALRLNNPSVDCQVDWRLP